VTAVLRVDHTAVAGLMRNPDGVVGRDNFRRATNVQVAARRQVGVRSGLLRRSLVKRGPVANERNGVTTTVESNLGYSLLHHDGTQPHEILPAPGKVLHFKVGGVDVFVRHVNHPGTRPNRYLTDNLKEALR
jgi:hypothetical protein